MKSLTLATATSLATAALVAAAGPASAAFSIYFSTPQTSVSFQSVSYSSTVADAFDSSDDLVDSVGDNEGSPITGQVDTLSGADITSVTFDYDGGYNGPGITNLMFGGVTIDFSQIPVGDSVGSYYASDGVTFQNAIVLQCAGGCPAPNVDGYFAYTGTGPSAVPEPVSWALMLVGFGGLGASLRSRRAGRSATA